MPPRAARQKNAIPAAAPVAGGSRLEQLPAELTQSIFDFLYDPNFYQQRDLIRPLSKHLLPYSTAALYRRIKITLTEDLGTLCTTVSSKSLAHHIRELECDNYDDNDFGEEHDKALGIYMRNYEDLIGRMIEGLLISATQLEILLVSDWNSIGKVVLSERFGREGGRALEKIGMTNCFGSIEGSIITAWSHLRHLPRLSSLEYYNKSLTFQEEHDNPPNLGGFKQLKTLNCALDDLSSPHAIQLGSLFSSSKLETVRLFSLNKTTRPNFAMLDSLPSTIEKLELHLVAPSKLTGLIQPPLSLNRFHKLQSLYFLDSRIFDEELVDQIITLSSHSLVFLEIYQKCQITFQLLLRFLSGLGTDSKFERLHLDSLMSVGSRGLSYKNGAIPVLENNILVPGAGWKRPDWTWITLLEAQEVERMCIEKGVKLTGAMKQALEVEEAFEEEERMLHRAMKFLRDGGQGWVKLD